MITKRDRIEVKPHVVFLMRMALWTGGVTPVRNHQTRKKWRCAAVGAIGASQC